MRKTLFMVVALSSLLWSGGLAEIWMGDHAHQIALFLIIAGVFLYGGAFVLFCVRFFQWLRVLKRQKIDLSGLNFFRRIEAIKSYQREAWLQAVLVFLIVLVVCIPLSFFQPQMDATLVLSFYLVLPLSPVLCDPEQGFRSDRDGCAFLKRSDPFIPASRCAIRGWLPSKMTAPNWRRQSRSRSSSHFPPPCRGEPKQPQVEAWR